MNSGKGIGPRRLCAPKSMAKQVTDPKKGTASTNQQKNTLENRSRNYKPVSPDPRFNMTLHKNESGEDVYMSRNQRYTARSAKSDQLNPKMTGDIMLDPKSGEYSERPNKFKRLRGKHGKVRAFRIEENDGSTTVVPKSIFPKIGKEQEKKFMRDSTAMQNRRIKKANYLNTTTRNYDN